MANIKTSLDYYRVDTDRYQDIRIKRLKKVFRGNGIAVYDYILCEIYRVRGCYIEWDESTVFDVAEYFDLKESQVREIVNYCCSVGLFDKELLASGSVLTSSAIQRRYIEMCTAAKRREIVIPEEYRIIPEQSEIIPETSAMFPSVCRKVKKSKVNNIPPLSPLGGNEPDKTREEAPTSLPDDPPAAPGKERKSCAKKKEAIDTSFVEPAFQPIVADWLAYKSERGQTYRQKGFNACYSKLLRLSRGDPATARQIVEEAMANNWAGFFELKPQINTHDTRTTDRRTLPNNPVYRSDDDF